jgi:N-acetylglucosaminyldiphosphoundecaprenol N-acetyl-beta-D-mannosaminyltransferase
MIMACTNKLDSFQFKGIKISDTSFNGLLKYVDTIIEENNTGYFCLTDVGNLMMAVKDSGLAYAINNANASIADGTPLEWYGKLIGHKKIERISGVTLFQELVHKTNYRHLLLGDTEEIQKKVIEKAKKANGNLEMTGYSPPFREQFTGVDNEVMLEKIRNAKANIIWVSFGGGKQEKWMCNNLRNIDSGLMVGVGAAFKFYTGVIKIPPIIIQRLGLQWTTRLKKNPRRWMTKGQLKFRVFFSYYLPFELYKAKKNFDKRK